MIQLLTPPLSPSRRGICRPARVCQVKGEIACGDLSIGPRAHTHQHWETALAAAAFLWRTPRDHVGLSISSKLIELMRGKLQVRSAPGSGSTFHFTISLRPASIEAIQLPVTAKADAQLNLSVLVVEDNSVNRKIITTQLQHLGCQSTVAVDGIDALASFKDRPLPDVILMDCHMPKMDGWETTRRVRALSNSTNPDEKLVATLPIIALTAAAEERDHCQEAGMNAFLTKPVKIAELRGALTPFARPFKVK
ncbi:MAG: response regulator [Nibricoccus sp.]